MSDEAREILDALAMDDPWYDAYSCTWCYSYRWPKDGPSGQHEDGCPWVRARIFLGKSVEDE